MSRDAIRRGNLYRLQESVAWGRKYNIMQEDIGNEQITRAF